MVCYSEQGKKITAEKDISESSRLLAICLDPECHKNTTTAGTEQGFETLITLDLGYNKAMSGLSSLVIV
ncbi:hypothetical protein HUJ05_010496 [Dendroctonus ponderosae]|nr:hypothetical protein HUJ05_010496 [Dendroctonus ponderosae]